MIQELDLVVLTRNVAEYGLEQGDVGTVVHTYPDKEFEVEFVTAEGQTVALLTLSEDAVRPINNHEILHVRALVGA